MTYKLQHPEVTASLFSCWNETLIWSCLQNIMGKIYADSTENPRSAMALLGVFCFFAGEPNKELVLHGQIFNDKYLVLMVPGNESWAELIEKCYGEKAKKVTRYAIKKEKDVFDKEKLREAVGRIPKGYSLQMMDEAQFAYCKKTDWCYDLVSQYSDYEMYRQYGLGAVILKDGELVSGASSYSSYRDGIEIEIDTKEEHRRKGLAYACGAKLILECLNKGWYPSWDAQNKWSVTLAEKLGYHFSHEYPAYEVGNSFSL